jgi:rare lipoprotein A
MLSEPTPGSCKMHVGPWRNLQLGGRFAGGVLPSLLVIISIFVALPAQAAGPKRTHPGETQTGMASWYGADQGRHTASGERFDPEAMTAAHRHLPFGTVVRVTNQLNGKSVDLRINDRGPWRHGRIIDVTDAAADVLDMKKAGTVPVTIVVLKLGPPCKKANVE